MDEQIGVQYLEYDIVNDLEVMWVMFFPSFSVYVTWVSFVVLDVLPLNALIRC